jgi:hypothetical protein
MAVQGRQHSVLSPDPPDQTQEPPPEGQKNLTTGHHLVMPPDHPKPLEVKASRETGQAGQVFTA